MPVSSPSALWAGLAGALTCACSAVGSPGARGSDATDRDAASRDAAGEAPSDAGAAKDLSSPPARGAASFRVQPQGDTSRCSVFSHIGSTGDPPVTRSDASGPRAVDGQGASVRCTLRAVADGFELSAAVETSAVALRVDSVGAVAVGVGSAAAVEVRTAQAGTLGPDGGGACSLDLGAAPLGVSAGRIWAGFSCPAMTGGTFATSACRADGVFLFEDCGG